MTRFPENLSLNGVRALTVEHGDPFFFTHENPPPLEGQEIDIVAYTQGWALQQGFVVGLSYHLRKMLQDASLPVLSSMRVLAPHGNYCLSHKGPNGSSFSEYMAFSLQSISQVVNILTLTMMEAGCLELGDGTRITDEEGRQALMKELRDFAEGGVSFLLSEWISVRPIGP
ncbi:hypothetical protein H4582DRAFT_2056109 [Lactarius indigo]|nr:hypothetical protein H4582DRAFT_2056109 [Lactarius indigo]